MSTDRNLKKFLELEEFLARKRERENRRQAQEVGKSLFRIFITVFWIVLILWILLDYWI